MNIIWFRKDLRLSDNPALFNAALNKKENLAIYILDEKEFIGEASKVRLHYALESLNNSLQGKLNLYRGDPKNIIADLKERFSFEEAYWNRCYEHQEIDRDKEIKSFLKQNEVNCFSFNGSLLLEPWQTLKDNSTPYKVYTAFYRKWYEKGRIRDIIEKPEQMSLIKDPNALTLKQLALLPENNWHKKLLNFFNVGEEQALKKLNYFIDHNLKGYNINRNFPAKNSCSHLSSYLHFGEISPVQIWHSIKFKAELDDCLADGESFAKEIVWREFSYYLLYHFPGIEVKNFNIDFDNFPWIEDEINLKKWQKGMTGFPIIDAGMRELWLTGTMHNRVRMIVASFLTKNLAIHWNEGAKWFLNCLLDANLASNSAGWQWVAGSGADAAPYFRIFNPITQGEKFDPEGKYILTYVPELKKLPLKYLFKPWEAPKEILNLANIKLGRDYPIPLIDLESSRNRALQSYKSLKRHQEFSNSF